MDNPLVTRMVGQYPVSIATSLALEGAFDIYPDRPQLGYIPIKKFDMLLINVRTLYRNIMGSLSKNDIKKVIPPQIMACIVDEIDMITSIVTSETDNRVSVIFYYSNYDGLETKYKYAQIRRDTTDLQKEYTAIHNQTIKLLLDYNKKSPISNLKLFNLDIDLEIQKDVLILTNYAYDLTFKRKFRRLSLLESHSGKVKEESQFYTKFHDGNKLCQIPFRIEMLQIFGDSTIFKPLSLELRKEILEIANKYNWSTVTTKMKIQYGIDHILNPYAKEIVRAIMHNT